MRPDELIEHVKDALPERRPVGDPLALPGGLMNAVYRVDLEDGSVVAKVVTGHVASAPEIPVDTSRADYEARALALFADRLADLVGDGLRVPRLVDFDPDVGVLLMEDLGEGENLVARLASGEPVPSLGERLGRFVARLHAATLGDEQLAATHHNAAVQATRRAVQYDAVGPGCRRAGHPRADDVDGRARALGERLLEPGRCLVQGDLWPSSLLTVEDGWAVIDWEFSHFGSPAQDLGHLAAHLWMLAHRAPSEASASACRVLLDTFLDAYREGTAMRREELLDARVLEDARTHLGCEVLARTVGAFQAGFLYDGLTPGDDAFDEAVDMAVAAVMGEGEDPLVRLGRAG